MGLFTEIGYRRLAKERKARFIREGREGESLGFYNRPDLNHPWGEYDPTPLTPRQYLLVAFALGLAAGFFTLLLLWLSRHPH